MLILAIILSVLVVYSIQIPFSSHIPSESKVFPNQLVRIESNLSISPLGEKKIIGKMYDYYLVMQ